MFFFFLFNSVSLLTLRFVFILALDSLTHTGARLAGWIDGVFFFILNFHIPPSFITMRCLLFWFILIRNWIEPLLRYVYVCFFSLSLLFYFDRYFFLCLKYHILSLIIKTQRALQKKQQAHTQKTLIKRQKERRKKKKSDDTSVIQYLCFVTDNMISSFSDRLSARCFLFLSLCLRNLMMKWERRIFF